MTAKVAVTTNKNGDKITEHAGHVVYFKIYEINQTEGLTVSKVIKVDKEHTLHNLLHNPDINPQEHEVLNSQILLTGGVGMGAINRLAQMGVRAYIVEEKNPDEAIEKLIAGTLRAVDPRSIDHSHHHHDHDHGNHDCDGHGHLN